MWSVSTWSLLLFTQCIFNAQSSISSSKWIHGPKPENIWNYSHNFSTCSLSHSLSLTLTMSLKSQWITHSPTIAHTTCAVCIQENCLRAASLLRTHARHKIYVTAQIFISNVIVMHKDREIYIRGGIATSASVQIQQHTAFECECTFWICHWLSNLCTGAIR